LVRKEGESTAEAASGWFAEREGYATTTAREWKVEGEGE
jgi:hypothetical protein